MSQPTPYSTLPAFRLPVHRSTRPGTQCGMSEPPAPGLLLSEFLESVLILLDKFILCCKDAYFGYLATLFAAFPFVIFENSPLFSSTHKGKSTQK